MASTKHNNNDNTSFEVYVSKDTFKFNAAHFVAFENFRERLHGHNYHVGVRLLGAQRIGADGYLIDFGNIKQVAKNVCKRLNEHFLCPMHSTVLDISVDDDQVRILCQDGSAFSFPVGDCALLPIVHATAEELAIYLYAEILNGLNAEYLIKRQIHTMEITVAEAPGQEATFRLEIPSAVKDFKLDVRSFISKGDIVPMPCLEPPTMHETTKCCTECSKSSSAFSRKLDRIAHAINSGELKQCSGNEGSSVTVKDIQDLLSRDEKKAQTSSSIV